MMIGDIVIRNGETYMVGTGRKGNLVYIKESDVKTVKGTINMRLDGRVIDLF